MNERPGTVSRGPDRGRWFMVAALILVGLALYFWFAPSSQPAAPPGGRSGVSDQTVRVTLPDGSVREVASGTTARAVAEGIGPGLARAAVAAKVDGAVWDLDRPHRARRRPSPSSPSAIPRRSRCCATPPPTSSPPRCASSSPAPASGSGPPIEDGFYYDFEVPRPFTPEDLERIEARDGRGGAGGLSVRPRGGGPRRRPTGASPTIRSSSSASASCGDDEMITVYTDGPFIDLCRGPHVPSTGRLKHFKLLHAAGAYWRGDEKRQMLQRIYGTAWFKKEDLDAYLHRLEEARKRDHRVIGKQLDLFSISDVVGPGLVLWHPQGRHDQVAADPRGRGRQRRQRLRPGVHAERHQGGAVQDLRATCRSTPRTSIRRWPPAPARRRTCAIGSSR